MWMDKAQHGEKPAMPDVGYTWDEIDRLNADTTARDRDRSLDDILNDFRRTYQDILEDVEALSERNLQSKMGVFRDPVWQSISANTWEHFHEHALSIRQWMQSKGYL
jgi:hypothetical protein